MKASKKAAATLQVSCISFVYVQQDSAFVQEKLDDLERNLTARVDECNDQLKVSFASDTVL